MYSHFLPSSLPAKFRLDFSLMCNSLFLV
uniref:Uncharacterized protein n=1 Tax=Anguilla anguilla TaxID=7936 RepID=A0A0E9SL28_ANGAN